MNTTPLRLEALPRQCVQVRTHTITQLQQAAEAAGLPFYLVHLTGKKSKAALLDAIARSLHFPAHFGGNLDALHDCLTDLEGEPVIVLEALASDHATDHVLDVFRETMLAFQKQGRSFRVFYHPVDTD